MIKATMSTPDGRQILLIGLSHANLDRLKADGLNGYIRIKDIGLPFDVIITCGKTEQDIVNEFKQFIGPETKVHDSRHSR